MARCIELAKKGLGNTYPNPLVGAVIVYKDQIIGEDYHHKAGEAHAEVNAINAVKDQELLKKSTIYVSLEPCSHYGKTPPCANLIIDKGIPNVVIGHVDPFAEVAGRGIKKLFEAGCHVRVGVLENECANLNKRFFCFHQKQRPYIILKWAQTADGFIAPGYQNNGEIFWISNAYAKQMVHQWRTQEAAILVGTATALKDNPQLSARHWHGKQPTRLVINRDLQLPETLQIFDQSQPTFIFHDISLNKVSQKNLSYIPIDFSKNVINQILKQLYQENLQSVIIEGGQNTLQHFIDENLWDEARIFESQSKLKSGIKSPKFKTEPSKTLKILDNQLKYHYNED
ncbi:diaminohydroxyphosphoribosylaminopyrimidine deaminase [Psychroflexus salarius]|uniref:Riboflavin biosynthesis protein RibD n=2 Tax=Psychroflexus salarius TaxID=1155689 RepID=A0A1M4SKN2_9FLAO|nr:diaminohydroxyphosphoribosylaminopyrimidine deaminase [Psychroflexus salarius]